jgi:Cu(I)/Ag(I) efflux system membrane protein CusA/SilA
MSDDMQRGPSPVDRLIRFCLEQKLVVWILVTALVVGGVLVAPFDGRIPGLPRRPVAVDAIPDIGENQQIVYSEWMGRSPRDVDDQVTYPLTVALLGVPGVRTVRSYSYLGFSMVYVIFEEGVPFEAAQNRLVVRLNSLPADTLPAGVKPALGPFATALGQIFWYPIDGREPDGRPAGGWDLDALRSLQDYHVRYHLQAAGGVAEVASVGGFVQEFQVDVDPDALRAHGIGFDRVVEAVRQSNLDTGARQIEMNGVEYLIRSRGFLKSTADLEEAVLATDAGRPVRLRDVARVATGPAMREGALDKGGAEAVGGVVVVRHGTNPLEAIDNVKRRIAEIAPSMPARAVFDFAKTPRAELERFATANGFAGFRGAETDHEAWTRWMASVPRDRWPAGATLSRATIVPFYDRTGLIHETLGTLQSALYEQILITTIVVILMAGRLGLSLLISGVMPLAVLFSFIAMKLLGVDANVVSLGGIAIAIGTIVDMGIIMGQSIVQHLEQAGGGGGVRFQVSGSEGRPSTLRPQPLSSLEIVHRAASEVGGAILTAISTTVIGFLPVFAMTGPEGRLFKPLAFTKTFCLIGSVVAGLTVIPAVAHLLLARRPQPARVRRWLGGGTAAGGAVLGLALGWWLAAALLVAIGVWTALADRLPRRMRDRGPILANAAIAVAVGVLLTQHWLPLGPGRGFLPNLVFVVLTLGLLLGGYHLIERFYGALLGRFLARKWIPLTVIAAVTATGYVALLGAGRVLGFLPRAVRDSAPLRAAARVFPGFGREFMPALDEGSFLYMPTTMPHASIGEAMDILSKQDRALLAIPEVESAVGKIGRAESALDPAPVNMIETVINIRPEYRTGPDGRVQRFAWDRARGGFVRENGELVPDPRGRPYRQWRDSIRTTDDIWNEIVHAAQVPGVTSAPRLQPIAARIVMLQSGMRAPMGVKVQGPDLESVEKAGLAIERALKDVPSVDPATVIADRIVGKPYLEIDLDREALARHGLSVAGVQEIVETAVGGMELTTVVDGRARRPVRVRLDRERRDSIEGLRRIPVPAPSGAQIPLGELASIRYERGPEMIRSEDSFLTGYVLLDRRPGHAEVDVVEAARAWLESAVADGGLVLPAGVTWRFAGNYENQVRAQQTLTLIIPLTLLAIFLLIYFQFRRVTTTMLVFVAIFVCWSGGLLLIWFYAQPWFLDVSVLGRNLRDLFQIHPVNMSVAVWVGFLALFGIATDDAVVICTYLDQRFAEARPATRAAVREAVVFAGRRRIRACLMTTATTVLALLPVLTSTGRGADLMVPMALPVMGGMLVEGLTLYLTPILYCALRERELRRASPASPWPSE